MYNWIKRFTQKKGYNNPSAKQVKSIDGYLDYLKKYPRDLAFFSNNWISMATSGYFHPSPEEHKM